MRSALAACVLLAPLVAGCQGTLGEREAGTDLPALSFPGTWDVHTTAVPGEAVGGPLRVAYAPGLAAIESLREPDLARRTVVTKDAAYTSFAGMGWIRHDLAAGIARGELSNRLILWDLPRLASSPGLHLEQSQVSGGELWRLEGTVAVDGVAMRVEMRLLVRDGVVQEANVRSPQGRESPFTFTRSNATLPFPLAVPEASRTTSEVLRLDTQAREAHVDVIQLVKAYQGNRGGLLPDRVDADTLRVEMLQAGVSWPANPYDGSPLAARDASGHFRWTRCGLQDGAYLGYGWDGYLVSQSYGRGCAAA